MEHEDKLVNPKKTIEVLKKYDFRFAKKFGQNFLIDPHVLEKIIDCSGITKDDCVMEIGPGIGTLTQFLCEAARQVVAVEIDAKLMPILDETLSGYDNVTVLNQDILKLDVTEIVSEYNHGKPVKVTANLPYYITTPIIMSLLEKKVPLERITVMVQKEVAVRMQAHPGTKDYGALSAAVSYYCEPYLAANVPRNCFMPRPNVDSAVICLKLRKEPFVKPADEKLMFAIIKAAFSQRRKTLVNALGNCAGLDVTKDEARCALNKMGIKEDVRGETLGLEEFCELSDILKSFRG